MKQSVCLLSCEQQVTSFIAVFTFLLFLKLIFFISKIFGVLHENECLDCEDMFDDIKLKTDKDRKNFSVTCQFF